LPASSSFWRKPMSHKAEIQPTPRAGKSAVPPSSDQMRINRTALFTWAIIIVPTALAIVARNADSAGAPWEPAEYLWWLALVLLAGTILLSNRAGTRLPKKDSGRPIHIGDFEANNRQGALSFGSLVLASCAVAASFEWRVGLAFLGLAAAWFLLWVPTRSRRVDLTAEIEARCSPQAAFDLVSDPRNWSSYFPELTAATLDGPIGQGSVIQLQMTRQEGWVVDAEERVTAFEPGRRFATAIIGLPRLATGSYGFEAVAGGTRIIYTYRSVMPLATALLGGRIGLGRKMAINRGRGMARVKQLLEGEAATSV
jgi:hypothetical protein